MNPRVPGNAIPYDTATAELLEDFRQRQIEVTSHKLNVIGTDLGGQSIPEGIQGLWPFFFHGAVVPMHTAHHDTRAQVTNVLFEADPAHQRPRSRLLLFSLVFVGVVLVHFVLEALEVGGVVGARRNQNSTCLLYTSPSPRD